MKLKKRRGKGVRVKKYQHGGYHGDPPYTAASDATSVFMPELQFQPVLQPLPDTRPVGPTIGPTTQPAIDAGSERYEAERRRREAIARGINPNLAFTIPPGLQGDPQAAAEYQYDNMLTSPIGQIATGMAFTPIDVGIEAALPFISSTYAGRQLGRLGEYVGDQVQRGVDAVEGMGSARGLGKKSVDFATEESIGPGYRVSQDVYNRRMQEYLSPEGQRRMSEKIADDLTMLLQQARSQNKLTMSPRSRQVLNRLEGAVVGGRVDPTSTLVQQELQYANQQVRANTFKPQQPGVLSSPDYDQSQLMALDDEYLKLKREQEISDAKYLQLIEDEEMLQRRGQFLKARRKSRELDDLEVKMRAQYERLTELKEALETATGDLLTTRSYHKPSENIVEIAGRDLIDPFEAYRVTAHEFQHLLQRPSVLAIDPATGGQKGIMAQSFRYGVRPTDLLKIENDLGGLLKFSKVPDKDIDLAYFTHAGRRGNPTERTAFLAELRESMVQKGAMEGSYDFVSPDMIDDFVKNQTKKGDLRIVDLFDFNNPEVRKIVADAMNKLPVVAAGAAAGGTQDFKYGGKIKIKKKRKAGYRTV